MVAKTDDEKSPKVETNVPDIETSPSDSEERIITQDYGFVPPDGGWVAWSQVVAAMCLTMLAWGYPSAFGVYQLYYRDTLRLPESQISWIGSLQIFLSSAMCTPSGRLADAGYIRSTVAGGVFLIVFGTVMTSLASEYWQIFLSQGLCTGLGLGVVFMPAVSVVNTYFLKNRSLAMAIMATGTGLGGVVFPATVQYLIPQVGFAWAVRCSSLVALAVGALSIAMLRPRLRPRKSGPLVEWDAFTELPYLLFCLASFLFFMALYFGIIFLNAYARNVIKFSTTDSVQLLLISNAMSIVGRPWSGYMADRHAGPINMYAIHIFILGIMIFAWTGVHSRVAIYVFSIIYGLANGAAMGLFSGAVATLTTDPRKMGTRYGMVCTICALAALAGPPTAGAIIDRQGGKYLGAQIWAGSLIVLGSVVMAGARVSITGWRLWVKA